MYKLIALDLDDTLLMPDLSVAEETVEVLRNASAKGVRLVIATGRLFPSALEYAQMLGSDSRIVCYNGSQIRTPDGGYEFSATVSPKLIRGVAEVCHEERLYLQCYSNDKLVIEKVTDETKTDYDYYKAGAVEVGDFLTAELSPSPKMLIFATPERVGQIRPRLERSFGDELHFTTSKDFLLEMMPKGISKRNTLSALAEKYGIKREECIACGDNFNDIEMVSWAGVGVAVANAVPELKACADFVCSEKYSFGVKEAVEKFVL